jgi:hypothetical protein
MPDLEERSSESVSAESLLHAFSLAGSRAGAQVAAQEAVTTDAFDCVADAWETYRHLQQLSWD